MSPSSFRISLDDPPPSAPPPKPANPAALTREERSNAGWHLRFIGWIIGLPSILSIAFVGAVGLWYAYVTTADVKTWLALSAGILIVTLFTAGLPIGAALNRENAPGVAKAAFGFWIACILLNLAVMANFAWHRLEGPAPVNASASAPHLSAADAGRLDLAISKLRYRIADYAELASQRSARFDTAENRQAYAAAQAELRKLETARYGSPASSSAPAPGLDLAAVALLMLIGAALGLLISASSLAAILTEKAATVRVEAAPEPQPAPSPIVAYHPGETADGFVAWARQCVCKMDGGKVRPSEAHASYLQFCARNDFIRPLAIQEFGRRLSGYLSAAYGIDSRHSNGSLYDNIALAPLGYALSAPTMNGAAA